VYDSRKHSKQKTPQKGEFDIVMSYAAASVDSTGASTGAGISVVVGSSAAGMFVVVSIFFLELTGKTQRVAWIDGDA
jgi:hypothetical protein